ncbi:MAG: CBS domain-containing protein, partial [Thioalkalivibrio sp.]|nr:CBS domain-containing protein [Thioalkalivibrio sp.]
PIRRPRCSPDRTPHVRSVMTMHCSWLRGRIATRPSRDTAHRIERQPCFFPPFAQVLPVKIKDRPEFKAKPAVMTLSANDYVMDAVSQMASKNYGASVIVDEDNKPVGIVTERDLLRRLLAKGLDARTTLVSEIMSSDLKLATVEDEVVDWLRMMSNERFRHLPVVDAEGRLINVMSQGDFVSYTWPQLLSQAKDFASRKFMERFGLYLFIGSLIVYVVSMIVIVRSVT